MKQFWSKILLYGASLGLLLVAMRFFQYKWLYMKNAVEWYAGMIAALFCAAGIWAGLTLGKMRKTTTPDFEQQQGQPDPAVREKLGITSRELEVLELMAQGHSNQEIADHLYVSLNTVKTHISNLLSKLDAQRRTQAIQIAKKMGLIA